MKAADWIDRLKAKRGWESDYRAAKELGVSRNTISNYRSRTPTLDDDMAVRVAALLEEEPEIIIIDQVAERTRSEPARAALGRALERMVGKGGVGGRGRLDITSVTSTPEGGDPAIALHRNAHRINWSCIVRAFFASPNRANCAPGAPTFALPG